MNLLSILGIVAIALLIAGCVLAIVAFVIVRAVADAEFADDALGDGSDNGQPATATGFDGLISKSFHEQPDTQEAR